MKKYIVVCVEGNVATAAGRIKLAEGTHKVFDLLKYAPEVTGITQVYTLSRTHKAIEKGLKDMANVGSK